LVTLEGNAWNLVVKIQRETLMVLDTQVVEEHSVTLESWMEVSVWGIHPLRHMLDG
jgi:hypothetical protein